MMEIVNTAIEVVIDRISLEINPLSGVAKDLGSALVTIAIIMACATWLSVLLFK
jgi:diacylglycerol kinase (ATP)